MGSEGLVEVANIRTNQRFIKIDKVNPPKDR